MRISGNIFDIILRISLPATIFYFFLFLIFHPRGINTPTKIFCLVSLCSLFGILITVIQIFVAKIKILKIDNGIIFNNKKFTASDIISIQFISASNSFNRIKFTLKDRREIKTIYVMDKPKFLGLFFRKESKTLNSLFEVYPDLKEKLLKA